MRTVVSAKLKENFSKARLNSFTNDAANVLTTGK